MVRFILIIFSIIVVFSSCENEKKKVTEKQINNLKEPLVGVNKLLVDKDITRIKGYYSRRKWDMALTKSGLFYEIYQEGVGDTIKVGDVVELEYKVDLLSGKSCYNSDKLGTKTFKVGSGGVEKGLEIGVLLLKNSSRARFIMAPFLAHGLVGDEKCIPPLSIIVYDIKIINVIKAN